MDKPLLWYFADPMCSWCWGFTPTIEKLRASYRPQLGIALVLGGLRPGETMPLSASSREEILHHWQQVHALTAQPFRFDGALPEGFVYNTEPACRAVLAAGSLDAEGIFPMYKAIQSAFYVEGLDVTRAGILAGLAAGLGMDRGAFLAAFDATATRSKTQAHFRHARQAGARGFPTLVLQRGQKLSLVTSGLQPLAEICTNLDARLDEAS